MCACFRKAITTLAFSPDGKYIVTGEVGGAFMRLVECGLLDRRVAVVCWVVCVLCSVGGLVRRVFWVDVVYWVGVSQLCGVMSVLRHHQRGLADSLSSRVAERPHAGGASVGRGRAPSGGRAAGAQVRRGLRDLLAQREVRGERGLPARHDGQRVELEGEAALAESSLYVCGCLLQLGCSPTRGEILMFSFFLVCYIYIYFHNLYVVYLFS